MQKLTIFYLKNCPYCLKAMDAVKELQSETPAYQSVAMEWIEETLRPEIADNYDYYYVPCIFYGKEKLYECSPKDDYREIKRQFARAFAAVAE